jgi:hypothetical protein
MDDRSLPLHMPQPCVTPQPRVIRTSEFSRLGRSLLGSTYERVVPIARVALCRNNTPRSMAGGQRTATRKVGA